MNRIKFAMHIAVAAMAAGCVVVQRPVPSPAPPVAQDHPCEGPHRLAIVDLDMYPDPVRQGEQVDGFRITVRSDRNGECLTAFEVRDDDGQVAGRLLRERVRPGTNSYRVPAVPGYRFHRNDHCFSVVADIARSWTPIDARRVECARRSRGGWTMNR